MNICPDIRIVCLFASYSVVGGTSGAREARFFAVTCVPEHVPRSRLVGDLLFPCILRGHRLAVLSPYGYHSH